MTIRAIIELLPYFAIAAICLGLIAAWVLRMDAYRKSTQKELYRLMSGSKSGSYGGFFGKIRGPFIVALIACLFLAFFAVSAATIVENGRMRQVIKAQEDAMLENWKENRAAEKESRRLKAKMEELEAQKALYTATIETLMKKGDASRPGYLQ
jgi:hypothetical protein